MDNKNSSTGHQSSKMSKAGSNKTPYYKYMESKRKPQIGVNMKGFLCSCNYHEHDTAKEAVNLLNKYMDLMETSQVVKDIGSIDIEEELKNEIADINQKPAKFKVVDSGARNLVFIKTSVEDPVLLAHNIISDIHTTKTQQTKYLIRLIPIEETCKASLDKIKDAFKPLLNKYFTQDTKTFSIVINRRNNSSFDKLGVIHELAEMITETNKEHKVDLSNAELSVVIEVIRSIALISVVPDFLKYKKYNLYVAAQVPTEVVEQDTTTNKDAELEETSDNNVLDGQDKVLNKKMKTGEDLVDNTDHTV